MVPGHLPDRTGGTQYGRTRDAERRPDAVAVAAWVDRFQVIDELLGGERVAGPDPLGRTLGDVGRLDDADLGGSAVQAGGDVHGVLATGVVLVLNGHDAATVQDRVVGQPRPPAGSLRIAGGYETDRHEGSDVFVGCAKSRIWFCEAAVAAVFGCVRSMVAMELSGELADGDYDIAEVSMWREMVAGACRENAIIDEPIDVEDDDPDEWDVLLECLEDCVLWDEDWAMEEHLDVDPDAAGRVKSFLGIEPDYFVAIQPDPSDAEAETLIAALRSLTRVAGQE